MPQITDADKTPQSPPQPLLAQAMTSVANAIFITDKTGQIIWVNDAFSRLSGYSPEDAIGQMPDILQSGRQSDVFYTQLWQTILAGRVWQGEVVDKRKDGSLYTVDEVITPLFDAQGDITHFIAIQHDITQQKQESERDHHLAYHDILTGLPNRALFLGVQQRAISYAKRKKNMFATLFLDLDGFKPINDTLGHPTGDQLLIAVGERLRAGVRQADTVARFGGDEFAILINDLVDTDVATALARKLLDAVSQPFVLNGQKINISTSIGIAIYPFDGEDPDTLLANADKAMYQAKKRGGNSYELYTTTRSQVH